MPGHSATTDSRSNGLVGSCRSSLKSASATPSADSFESW
jgi:hypothetical protein